ncbi:MAG: hypothetical protein HYY82_16390, partial [Deltaproteobacteria bacterium]|nr:hypothetical protein [Deltaproteobacteria bacterium]
RLDQDFNQPIERRIRPLVDLIQLHRPDGMLDDQNWMVGRAEGFLFGFRQCIKGVRDDRHGKPATFL